MKESAIVKAILEALSLDNDVMALRINSGCILLQGRAIQLAPAGTSDILGVVTHRRAVVALGIIDEVVGFGVFFALEVKVPGSRTKPSRAAKQAAFREDVRRLGGAAAVVSTVDEALAFIARAKRGESE